MSSSRVEFDRPWRCCSSDRVPAVGLGLGDPTELELVADLGLRLVDPEGVDQDPLAVGVLGDRLAVDRGYLAEVLAHVRHGRRGDERQHADEDDHPEGEVDVEVVAIVRIPAGAMRPLGRRLGAEGHSDVGSCRWIPAFAGGMGSVSYTTSPRTPFRTAGRTTTTMTPCGRDRYPRACP